MKRKTDEEKAKTLAAAKIIIRAKAREKWAMEKSANSAWFLKKKAQNLETCKRRKMFRYEHKREMDRAWRLRNKEHVNAKSREWKIKNPNRHKAHVHKALLKYAQTPKGRAKNIEAANKRSRRLKNCICDFSGVRKYMELVIAACPVNCTWCSRGLTSKTICFDHVVPITRGGHHTADNLTPSCKSCNSSKSNKLLSEWFPRLRMQLGTPSSPFGWSPAKEVEYNRYWGRIPWNTPIPEGERTFKTVSKCSN